MAPLWLFLLSHPILRALVQSIDRDGLLRGAWQRAVGGASPCRRHHRRQRDRNHPALRPYVRKLWLLPIILLLFLFAPTLCSSKRLIYLARAGTLL